MPSQGPGDRDCHSWAILGAPSSYRVTCYSCSNVSVADINVVITIITINAVVFIVSKLDAPRQNCALFCPYVVSLLPHQAQDKWGSNDLSVAPSTDRKSCAQTTKQCTLLPSVCLPLHPVFQTVPAHKYISREEIPDANCIYSHLLTSSSHNPGVDLGL